MNIVVESPRRSSGQFSTSPSSPEFEFWMVGNHPELEPNNNLLSADELIVDGVLLPLHHLSLSNFQPNININININIQDSKSKQPEPEPEPEVEVEAPTPITLLDSSICFSTPSTSVSSKRWKDIFKVGERKKEPAAANDKERIKKDRKGCNNNGGGSGNSGNSNAASAELNINIWPFSRSRSAGTAAACRPKLSAAMRKSSSAPCSRSNSRGESSSGRRWAASPGRSGVGVHVGRASPVWQVKRPGPARVGAREKVRKGGMGGGVRGLNLNLGLNVNSCIGYGGAQGRCRGEDSDGVTGGERSGGGAGGGANGSLFRFRALFSKKVY